MTQFMHAVSPYPILHLIIAISVSIFVISKVYCSPTVQRMSADLFKLFKRIKNAMGEAAKSPFQNKYKDHPVIVKFVIGFLYFISLWLLIYGVGIIFLASMDDILWYKRLVGLLFGFATIYFSFVLKADGDKELYKLRSN